MDGSRPLIIQNLTLPPAGEWSPDGEGWTVVCVADGSGYCLQKRDARELRPGDGFTVPHNVQVTIRASRLGALLLRHFQIQPELLNGLLTVAESWRLKTLPDESAHIYFFTANERNGQVLFHRAGESGHETLAIRCALLQLWANGIAELFGAPEPEKSETPKLRDHFSRLVEQLPEAELLNFSPADLAEQLRCSERHFRRLFQKKFGVPFRQHQIELRLQRASRLLCDSNLKIASIAGESGYHHLGLFNSAFKRRFGMTPGEWRRRHGEAQQAGRCAVNV